MLPMTNKRIALGLDIGEKRIGVAVVDSISRLAVPLDTLRVDGQEARHILQLARQHEADCLVVGLPRNASGLETQQSAVVRSYATRHLVPLGLPVLYQDESLTSVAAEARLAQHKKSYSKAAIDAEAAAIIAQDYMEAEHARYTSTKS